jgi:hypothetical protein
MLRLRFLTLVVVTFGCARGPSRADRLITDFPQNRAAMERIAQGLSSLTPLGVIGLAVHGDSTVFVIHDSSVTLADAQSLASTELDPLLSELATLAPAHVINAFIRADGEFVSLTWSAGVPAGGGYARPGSGGEAALRSRDGIDYLEPIPGDSRWFIWGT